MTPNTSNILRSRPTGNLNLVRQNVRAVKRLNPWLPKTELRALRELTVTLRLSITRGEVLLVGGKWYVSHAGLLRIALRRRCSGIRTFLQERQSDPIAGRWVFRATVYKRPGSKGFVGYGDADPSNVSALVRGAEMRVAETRAVNRALRKAYGIGLCSVEELGWAPPSDSQRHDSTATNNGNGNGANGHHHQPRLRDRLCLLIRQHRLDPTLVKSYAAEFCGTSTLREASRERLEEFVNRLSEQATTDRDALVCQLNGFQPSQEVQP